MFKSITLSLLFIISAVFAQSPYDPGETVLNEHNISWTDNAGHNTNIFDEILINQKVVVIFWGGHG